MWARKHHRRTGRWPTLTSGAIHNAPGGSWNAIDLALRKRKRGLRGPSSLARLLASRCGVRNPARQPRLTTAMILRWADAYYARHGCRPTGKSGLIEGTAGETWLAIDKALRAGRRMLPGGSSLARLLDEKRPATAAPVIKPARVSPCQ